MLGHALLTTDCISATNSKGFMPSLPIELLDMVVQSVVHEMRRSQNGTAMCALMHTSSMLRFRCIDAFKPIALCECETPQVQRTEKLLVHCELFTYMWNVLQYRFLTDVSTKRHGKRRPTPPHCSEVFTTNLGSQASAVKVTLELDSDTAVLANGTLRQAIPEALRFRRWGPSGAQVVTVNHACQAVDRVLDRCDAVLRSVSPYMRALRGSLNLPADGGAGITVRVKLQLENLHIDKGPQRHWKFVTQVAGKSL